MICQGTSALSRPLTKKVFLAILGAVVSIPIFVFFFEVWNKMALCGVTQYDCTECMQCTGPQK